MIRAKKLLGRLNARLLLAGLWCGARLPFAGQLILGRLLGKALWVLMPKRKHIARINLALCFPHESTPWREDLLKRHFEALGTGFIETGTSWWGSNKTLAPLLRLNGMEHLTDALKQNQGVILLSAHFTTFELALRLLSLHTPCVALYRPHNNPLLEQAIRKGRLSFMQALIPREEMKTMLRMLAQNRVVWYAPDQNYNRRHGVFVPFFAEPAATMTATSRLARLSGAAVVPFYPHRLPGTQGYELVILPALKDFPGKDATEDTRHLNELLEQQVRRSPEQYLWVHRRFKTRPGVNENVYR